MPTAEGHEISRSQARPQQLRPEQCIRQYVGADDSEIHRQGLLKRIEHGGEDIYSVPTPLPAQLSAEDEELDY